MAIFTISPLNSLQFVKIDALSESFNNTPYDKLSDRLKKVPYCQKVLSGEALTIQIKTNYSSITAILYNIRTNSYISLTPASIASFTNYSFWEIPVTISTNGYYKIIINASATGFSVVKYESEMIEVRSEWDGVKICYYNLSNTPYVDYATGLTHLLRVYGILKFSDVGGKDEIYNNFGKEERIYSENETIYQLLIEEIPYYLVRQILYASKLDVFCVNDVNFVCKEHSISEHNGSHSFDLTLKLTQKAVFGINTDDTFAGIGGIDSSSTVITSDDNIHTGDAT